MGKGEAVLGIIGILIGAGGLTFGIIAWSSTTAIENKLRSDDALYIKNDGPFNIDPPATVLEIPNLNVTFDLGSPTSVFLSFTCHAEITAAGAFSRAFFFFGIDGVNLDYPVNIVGSFQGGSTTDFFSVSLQHLIENMAAGSHNVTVRVSTDSTGNSIRHMTLYVKINP